MDEQRLQVFVRSNVNATELPKKKTTAHHAGHREALHRPAPFNLPQPRSESASTAVFTLRAISSQLLSGRSTLKPRQQILSLRKPIRPWSGFVAFRIHCGRRMPHTKADLIATIAFNRNLPMGRAEAIVNQIFTAMAETLVRGEGIEIRGFGSFTVRHYVAYEGRNPRTGAAAHVEAKRVPFFKVGKELRKRIEAGRLAARVLNSGKPRSSSR